MPNVDRLFQKLTTSIFKAALDSRYWQDVIRDFSEACDYNPVSLLACQPGTADAPVVLDYSVDEAYVASYIDIYCHMNCWAEKWSEWEIGKVFRASELVAQGDLKRTEFYNDWLRPQENLAGGTGVIVANEGNLAFCLGATIRAKHLERDEETAAKWISVLLPYIRQAREIARVLNGVKIDSFVARQGLHSDGAAVFLISDRRTLLQANDGAVAMLGDDGGPVRIGPGNRVNLAEVMPEDRLGLAISSPRRGLGVFASPFSLFSPMGGFVARVLPLDTESAAEIAPDWFGHRPTPSVLLLVEKRVWPADLNGLIPQFGLTRSEADIATRLADGQTLVEIAAARHASIHTVRNQLKSVRSKTGVRRQAELVAIVERLRRGK